MLKHYPQMIEDRPEPVSIEYRKLWAAVINQAGDDINGVPDWRDKNSAHWRTIRRERAEAWLVSARTDCGSFLWICDTLRIDPSRIRTKILSSPFPSRGEGRGEGANALHLQSKAPAKTLDLRQRTVPGL
jgi:hypothetical protein